MSRVVAMVMSPAAPLAVGEATVAGTREEDVVTAVDGAREALTEEQHAALARRIRLAMEHPGLDQTLLLGTPLPPAPSPVAAPPSSFIAPPPNPSSVPPASGERAPLSFKKTMLLGLPRLSTDASPASSTAASSVTSVRASVVRDVGPPSTPPPRRSRRAGFVYLPDAAPDAVLEATELAEDMDAELEPPDHDAFELDHRIVSPERAPEPVNRQAWPGLAPARVVSPAPLFAPTPPAPRAGLILPPPPGPRDLEPSSPELPTTDPFAGFIAPPPSLARRGASVMVGALAVVGAFALAALAVRWLTHAAW